MATSSNVDPLSTGGEDAAPLAATTGDRVGAEDATQGVEDPQQLAARLATTLEQGDEQQQLLGRFLRDQHTQSSSAINALRGENDGMRVQLATLIDQMNKLGPAMAQAGQAAGVATQAADAARMMASWTQAAQQAGQSTSIPTVPATASHVRPPKPSVFRGAHKEPRISEWAHQAQQFLLSAGLADTLQGVFHITNYLGDEAAIWWRLYYQRVERGEAAAPVTWWMLKELMLGVFTEVNRDTMVRERFARLAQKTTVARYNAEFQAIILELPDIPDQQQVFHYLRGLKSQVQLHTRTHKPQSLMHAMMIADEADMAIYTSQRGKPAVEHVRGSGSRSNGPVPMQTGAVSLSPDEKARCQRDGLCFTCKKPGHSARECRSGKSSGRKKGKGGKRRPTSKN